MSGDSTNRAESLFHELAECSPQARAQLLNERCGADTELRAEVEALLQFHDGAGEFMQHPPSQTLGAFLPARGEMEHLPAGARLGGFTIERVLGEGGMGVVYVARQERPSRTVALKVIRRGYSTPSLLRRFEHEAEVLGRLQHPGIAQIFEAGSVPIAGQDTKGTFPYIAMELVDGEPLTRFATRTKLDMRGRLALLAKVCDAVHHAHQRGIIHRDLKPANILVARDGQPKVLDFGVARAADSDLRVTTMQTGIGQLIGTLPYMSPEQVIADPSEVDIRSDVYALGVVLYQLLTDKLPHDLASRSIPEAARVIRDEAPARLSSISRVFRGEVDTIVGKALEKDKARRYQSAADLGADIIRFLAGEPIAAKEDSAFYVLRKQLNRYRGAVAAGIAIILLLAGFAAYAQVQSVQNAQLAERESGLKRRAEQASITAQHAQAAAETERKRADATAITLAQELSLSNIERGRLSGLTGNVLGAEELIWPELFSHPESKVAAWALRELYMRTPYLYTLATDKYREIPPLISQQLNLVALPRRDGVIELRSFDLLTHLGETEPVDPRMMCAAIARNGRTLAIGSADGSVTTVDLESRRATGRYKLHSQQVMCIAFSPDNTLIATGSLDRSVCLTRADTGEILFQPSDCNDRVLHIGFSSDGNQFIAARPNAVCYFSVRDGRFVRTFTIDGAPSCMAVGDDERLYIVTGKRLGIYNNGSAEGATFLELRGDGVRSIELSHGDTHALLGGAGFIQKIELSSGNDLAYVAAGDPSTLYVAGVPGRSRCITLAGLRGFARLWELAPRPDHRSWRVSDSTVTGGVIAPDGKTLYTVGSEGAMEPIAWNIQTGERTGSLVGSGTTWLRTPSMSADGSLFAAASPYGRLFVWNTSDGTLLLNMECPRPNGVTLNAAANRLITSGSDGHARVWELPSGRLLHDLPVATGAVRCVAARPGTSEVAVAGGSPGLAIIDATTGKVLRRTAAGDQGFDVAYSTDGRFLALPVRLRTVEVRDAESLKVLCILSGNADSIVRSAFSPDGELIATGGADGVVKLWEAATGHLLATLDSLRSQVSMVAFTPDGRNVIVTGEDKQAHAYDLTYYDHHVAGNVQYQLDWQRDRTGGTWTIPRLMDWSQQVLTTPSR